MTVVNMTAHEALAKIKLYDSKIEKRLEEVDTVGVYNDSELKTKDVKRRIKNNGDMLTSLVDLMENRRRLKNALILSNAKTKVEIGGKEYTVAEAISFKETISYYKTLLDVMERDYQKCTTYLAKKNKTVEKELLNLTEILLGSKTDDVKDMEGSPYLTDYYKKKCYKMITVDNYDKIKERLERLTEDFETEVDFKLSASNAVTIFEVELV